LSLNKQIHLYGVGTDYFFNKKEDKINSKLVKARITKSTWRDKIISLKTMPEKKLKKLTEEQINEIKKNNEIYNLRVSEINKVIKIYKNKLLNKLKYNDNRRKINISKLKTSDIISSFESTLTRVLECDINAITEEIMFVQTYYYEVAESLIKKGFNWNGERYIAYTASAGQIRLKKFVVIKESTYEKHKMTLTCGLTEEIINDKGGINTNKYLAYLALNNSATEIWKTFDIDKSIVVEDFETNVGGLLDYIDYETYKITPNKYMSVPIPHTDGIGMYLSDKNRMVRAPWIKGLMTPFRYDKFILKYADEYPDARCIKDIYGKEYDIIKDNIQCIFTKSQFKMWKYYDSWDHYKSDFKENGCHASYCNEEVSNPPNAKIGYQMLQTLTDITNDEIDLLMETTISNITDMGENVGVMLKVLGASKENYRKNNHQKALSLYPELLQDPHSRETLKSIKESLVKEGKGGKISINGKYTFICPDMYAFSEWLFLGIKNPDGLLKGNEVSCNLYQKSEKLDVLRSPSLYREHFVGDNTFDSDIRKWFTTNAIYMSSHCFASLLLMYDVDGDQSLVCADPTLIKVAERNMDGIHPLYYDMKKAPSQVLNVDTIYAGLDMAYKNTSIGVYSNNITKVWNSDEPNLDVIKLLCLESNFSIDSTKTLFFIERPENENNLISRYTKSKMPHFFTYAKDKLECRVLPIDLNTTMGRIESRIPDKRLTFKSNNLPRFDYTMLMKDKGVELNDKIIERYKYLNRKVGHYAKRKKGDDGSHMYYVYNEIKEELLEMGNDDHEVIDIIIAYAYGNKSKYKNTIWSCFGDIILNNLKTNIIKKELDKTIVCNVCGTRAEKKGRNSIYCDSCAKEINRKKTRARMKSRRNSS
jgi:hypothetical protein